MRRPPFNALELPPRTPPMTDTDVSQKRGWLRRLTEGLSRSSKEMSEQVVSVFTKSRLDQDALDRLEDLLIEADLGPQAAQRVTEAFGKARFGREATDIEVKESLAEAIASELAGHEGRFEPLAGGLKQINRMNQRIQHATHQLLWQAEAA